MSIGGIVFLGTPHRLEGVNNRDFGERVVSILKLEDVAGSISRQGLSRLKESSSTLDGLATRFNRTNLRVDMLSIYEQKLTRIRDTGPLRSKVKRLIVTFSGNIDVSEGHTSTYVNVSSSSHQTEIQSLLDNFSIHQADPKVPCFMVETFEALSQLDEYLLPAEDLLVSSQPDRIRVGLLCGMGGLGKTEIAIEYIHSRKSFFDAIFWVRAEDSSKLESDIAQIAVRLGIQDPNEPDDKVINRELALQWLCNPFKREHIAEKSVRVPASWLLVFDNADEPDILAPYRDITKSGAVLITSRSPLARSSFSPHTVNIDIQPFDSEESGDFIQKIAGVEGHINEARDIGQRLGGLPLALAQMAGVIRLQFLSYSEFLQLYNDREEESDILETVLQPLRTTARGNLSTVWAIESFSESARAIIEISSFLDPDCIQESILTDYAASVEIPSYPKKKSQFFAARKQLIGTSLFRHNQDLAEYWMHRVTQDVVRSKIEPERRKDVFSNAVAIVTSAWPASTIGGHDITLWEMSEKLYPHVTSLRELYTRYFVPENDDMDMAFASLLSLAGWYQLERGESHTLLPVLELALELCNSVTTFDTRDLESDIHYTIGATGNETNNAELCIKHTKEFLEIRLEVAQETGKVDERLARSHNQIGIAWVLAEEYEKAEEAFQTSAREYENIPNYTKDKRSLPLVNLGLTYWLRGKLDEASEVLELGLKDREELFGYMDNYSFHTGRFLHALGNVCFSQGRIEESESFHSRALKQYQSTIRRHHRTADVCHKMAQHCLRKRLFEEALEFVDQALKVWHVDPEKYAPEIARTSYLKAKVLFSAGQEEEGTKLFRTAASMRRKLTGDSAQGDKDLNEDEFDRLVTFWSR
ncbi:P-loop containing nucleoside triphosphate hydrolase protein [Annulohypoxylon moriforme]|nr:P-loop containing nucleoside triphosphate hydrolase protein [Annulohypoxylon moriforme]